MFDNTDATDYAKIKDFAKYPELRWLNKYYVLPPMFGGFLLYLYNGWAGFVWGGRPCGPAPLRCSRSRAGA